jgi:quercetin dioxygenase-like cupin family protein
MRYRICCMAVAGLTAFASSTFAIAADPHPLLNASDLKWVEAEGLPKGAKLAVLHGDPGKSGPFVIALKAPANYVVPPHWHSQDEALSVVSGTMHMGEGDKVDKKKARALKAGGFAAIPANHRHWVYTTVPTVIHVYGTGPFDIKWVNEADAPKDHKSH